MPESWVRPPVVAREAAPAWRATLAYRLVALVALVAFVALVVVVYTAVVGPGEANPGLGT